LPQKASEAMVGAMSDDLHIIQRSIEANGITFACDECGSGGNIALLLHSLPESRISWRHPVRPACAARPACRRA
jgi:hypothetical protein